MKRFEWNKEKNEILKATRNISFEEIVASIYSGGVLDIIPNPNIKYPNQKVYIVNVRNYAYVIPFVEDEEKNFLKTIFPSRKLTRKYIIEGYETDQIRQRRKRIT
ncbi:MAG: toxin [bacterium]|nr:toxin [bacterium]